MALSKNVLMAELMDTLPQVGEITWIGLRSARRAPLTVTQEAMIDEAEGLVGDHFVGKRSKKRQVTLIQAEHIAGVGSMLHRDAVDPGLLRRNIVVKGINLLALKDKQFQIGDAVLEMTGLCHPCSRMEENLGPGGYNAMRGHGGITARVIKGGKIQMGDRIQLLDTEVS
ncbi:MAG: MOSC domain-containing protein [Bacteroidota bacterium]